MNSCSREACQVTSTGKCLEAFEPPSTCPYLMGTVSTSDELSAGNFPFIELPSGEALSEEQASEVTRQGVTRVVVLAGPSGSGKTTILTSLFEAFLDAPFGNFMFAGSRTLAGFERRCHDARVESGRPEPHTIHTRAIAAEFLHLRLAYASGSLIGPQNLLLSDISGERFRAMRDSTDAVKDMPILHRADHLCIVLDGEKLIDANLRHSVRSDARSLLRSIIEAGMLAPTCKIEIAFAKWDIVRAQPDQDSLSSFIGETKSALLDTLKTVATPEFVEIAARPRNSRLPFAFGLPTLLRYWLDERKNSRPKLYVPEVRKSASEAIRFAKSVVEEQRLGEFYDVRWV